VEKRIRLELNEFWGRHCENFGGTKGKRTGEYAGNEKRKRKTEVNGPS